MSVVNSKLGKEFSQTERKLQLALEGRGGRSKTLLVTNMILWCDCKLFQPQLDSTGKKKERKTVFFLDLVLTTFKFNRHLVAKHRPRPAIFRSHDLLSRTSL